VILAAGILSIGFAIAFLVTTIRLWRELSPERITARSHQSALGPIYSVAVQRSFVVFTLIAVIQSLIGVLSPFDSADNASTVLAFLWMACLCLCVVIMATNQPRFLVPPARRSVPGALEAERRARTSDKRSC
jgi:hypothetical protein